MSITPEERRNRHHFMAVEANNRAWGLSTAVRTPADDREMVDAAHAAAWHWSKVGTELNAVRADALLAEVYALIGEGARAWTYVERVDAYFAANPGEPWELAFLWLTKARAAKAMGKMADYAQFRAEAVARIDALEADDREIVMESFRTLE